MSIAEIPTATVANTSFWEQGLNQGDVSYGYVTLAFLDNDGLTIATVSSSVVDSHDALTVTSTRPVAPAVPEPGSMTLLAIGLASFASQRRRAATRLKPDV